jgi:hypothetical protein
MYPNPAVDFIHYKSSAALGNTTSKISSLTGSVIQCSTNKISDREYEINTSNLTCGTYLLLVQDEQAHSHTYLFSKK